MNLRKQWYNILAMKHRIAALVSPRRITPFWVAVAGILIMIAGFGIVGWRLSVLSAQMQALSERAAASASQFEQNIGALAEQLAAESEKSLAMNEGLMEAQEDIEAFERRFGRVSNTVEELEKLTKADPKLLQKYSKVFFLNEHYEPERLSQIEPQYVYSENQTHRIHSSVLPYLEELIDDAKEDGITLYVKSAYRSFEEQHNIKSSYVVTYGAGTANQFSAEQGYSEHQLGTTVDLITTGLGGELTQAFDQTTAFQWLVNNAHKYGFVLSYPKGNSYYIYEPWHWRFVGEDLAGDLRKDSKYFYDLEQREIDEYLPEMFD